VCWAMILNSDPACLSMSLAGRGFARVVVTSTVPTGFGTLGSTGIAASFGAPARIASPPPNRAAKGPGIFATRLLSLDLSFSIVQYLYKGKLALGMCTIGYASQKEVSMAISAVGDYVTDTLIDLGSQGICRGTGFRSPVSNSELRRKVDNLRYPGASQPSALVRRFASYLLASSQGVPILDIACGAGRNGVFLARLGCKVICVDKDLTRLQQLCRSNSFIDVPSDLLKLHEMDLVNDPWPFEVGTAAAIISVHFLQLGLFPHFARTLAQGGYLLIETIPAHGGNYLALPRAGQLRSALEHAFEIMFYRERKAGPGNFDAVTVQLVARRR
jgi:hypothetical protein